MKISPPSHHRSLKMKAATELRKPKKLAPKRISRWWLPNLPNNFQRFYFNFSCQLVNYGKRVGSVFGQHVLNVSKLLSFICFENNYVVPIYFILEVLNNLFSGTNNYNQVIVKYDNLFSGTYFFQIWLIIKGFLAL